MPINKLILVSVLVKDQDEALKFYMEKLGFIKKHDLQTGLDSRWLVVAPSKQNEIGIVLRKPHAGYNELITNELDKEIGRGTQWTFSTTNCKETFEELRKKGVNFIQEPTVGEFGIEAIFEDLYDNRFSILEIS